MQLTPSNIRGIENSHPAQKAQHNASKSFDEPAVAAVRKLWLVSACPMIQQTDSLSPPPKLAFKSSSINVVPVYLQAGHTTPMNDHSLSIQ